MEVAAAQGFGDGVLGTEDVADQAFVVLVRPRWGACGEDQVRADRHLAVGEHVEQPAGVATAQLQVVRSGSGSSRRRVGRANRSVTARTNKDWLPRNLSWLSGRNPPSDTLTCPPPSFASSAICSSLVWVAFVHSSGGRQYPVTAWHIASTSEWTNGSLPVNLIR